MSSFSRRAVVFTDLDATLLDHDSYDISPAAATLQRLAVRDIPVCFCTSKTRAELIALRRALNNVAPFAAENGGVIGVPRGYFDADGPVDADAIESTVLGVSYAELRMAARELREHHGYRYTGFGDMSVEDVVAATGLARDAADAARQREASEPLLWQDSESAEAEFAEHVAERGLVTRRGGRFMHLLGQADKADALRWLKARFTARYGPILAVALGDSANDAEMLAAADIGFWVERPNGGYYGPAQGSIRHAPGIGPIGWARAIDGLIASGEI